MAGGERYSQRPHLIQRSFPGGWVPAYLCRNQDIWKVHDRSLERAPKIVQEIIVHPRFPAHHLIVLENGLSVPD